MSTFITCKVVDLKDHPQATKLKIATVNDGSKNYSVVCGAKNIRLNMITILAQIGATTAQGLTIKESAIRGINSEGMLCSPLELGVAQEQGIVDLAPTTKLGMDIKSISAKELSSTPWWQYKLVEQFYTDKDNKIIVAHRPREREIKNTTNMILSSETYWFDGQYYHRHF